MKGFELTPDEARPVADSVIEHLQSAGMGIKIEVPAFDDAPYRTTLVATAAGKSILVEAQGELSYGNHLHDLAQWVQSQRKYAELYLAVSEDATLQAGVLRQLHADGVGLMVVRANNAVDYHSKARNPALTITVDPTLPLGRLRRPTFDAVAKFNDVNRKDGLRDMCEIVEKLTADLGAKAARRSHLNIDETAFRGRDWNGQINLLASPGALAAGRQPVISDALKNDLHSFRGARNLVDHPAPTARESKQRAMQFAERMMQGPRLVAELLRAGRRIR